jgi:hypothetical protein
MSRACVVKGPGGVAWSAMAGLLVALVIASPAGAAPKGIFSVFGSCPVSEVNGRNTEGESPICLYVQAVGGVLRIGRATVPVDRAITVQAGGLPVSGGWDLVPPSGGTILPKTQLEIPGGLNGELQCGAIGGRVAQASCGAAQGTEVTATLEVVAGGSDPAFVSADAFLFGSGPLLVLPARVHLGNAFLGSGCYIGSSSHPITLEMTFGTTSPPAPNKPISGLRGSLDEERENGLEAIGFPMSVLVDNTFSAPVAEGCGGQLSSLVDPLLDAKLDLPSKAGYNTAILDAGVVDAAAVEQVIESEE